MKSIILRPLAVFTIAFYILSCILFTADRALILWSAVIFSSLFVLSLSLRRFIPKIKDFTMKGAAFRTLSFFLAGCALASIVTFYTLEIKLSKYNELCNSEVLIEGTVTDVIWDGGYSGIYIVTVENIRGYSSFKCILTTEGGLRENTKISANVSFSHLENNAQFNERTYYLSQNVYLKANSQRATPIGSDKLYFTALARNISNDLSEIFYNTLGTKEGSFASALLLGNTSRLPDTVGRDFKRLGISHVLAISGMHLAILCTFVTNLLKPLGKRAVNVGCILLVLFYIFVTGFAPTVVRSGIMVLLPIVASDIHKSTDRFTLLGVSVFLICIINPFSAGDIGLQLSFAALMAIFLLTDKREGLISEKVDLKSLPAPLIKAEEFIKSLFEEAFLSTVIILFMLPLEWLYFKQICPVAPLISPVFSLFCNILLWALPVLLLLSPAPTFAVLFAYPLKLLISFIINSAEKLSSIENITISLNYPFAFVFSIVIFLSVCAFCVTKSKKRLICASVSVILILSFILSCAAYSFTEKNKITISMLTYKTNDGLCLVSQNKTMIIDMGNGYSGILREGSEFLKSTQTTEIEILMLTHYHKSYNDSVDRFLSRNIVRNLLIPCTDNDIKGQLERLGRKHGVSVLLFNPNEKIEFEDAVIIPSENAYIKRSVQPIVRIDIEAKGKTFTYVGGSYSESAPDTYFDCNYLFFGDHGPLYKKKFEPHTAADCSIFASQSAAAFIIGKNDISNPCAVVWE